MMDDYLSQAQRYGIRLAAQEDLYLFNRFMFREMRRYRWSQNFHHEIICNALMDVYHGRRRNIIINVPPRYSKTELAVVGFIAWAMGKSPDSEFIHATSTKPLGVNNSYNILQIVKHREYQNIFNTRLMYGSTAKDHWRTTEGGSFYAAGTNGQITGFGAGKKRTEFGGAIIADDLHKAVEARSKVKREGVHKFFVEGLQSRRNDPGNTPIIVIGQRLHEEDICGFLINNGLGEHFDLICLPAIQDDGTALWPQMHNIEQLRLMQLASPYMFAGQYQQQPAPPEGNIFRPYAMPIIDAIPIGTTSWVRAWDLAATEEDGDWTVGALLGIMPDQHVLISDIVRLQGGPDTVRKAIHNTAARDGKDVRIKLPQDPGQAGKDQAKSYVRQLAGYTVVSQPVSGDKIVRAEPVAAQVNVGNVCMLRSPSWNNEVIDEMRLFPNAAHDDIIDAVADAYNTLYTGNMGILDFYRELLSKKPGQT